MSKFRLAMLIALFTLGGLGHTQSVQLDQRYQQLNEGQLFTVKIIPGARKVAVYVTGKTVADLKVDDLGLSASVHIGKRVWKIEPKKSGDHFEFEAPKDAGAKENCDLRLRVKHAGDAEDFKFQAVPAQP